MVIVNVTRGTEAQVPEQYEVESNYIDGIKSDLIHSGVGDGYFYIYRNGGPELLPYEYYRYGAHLNFDIYYHVYTTHDELLMGQIFEAVGYNDQDSVEELVSQLHDINSLNDRSRSLLYTAVYTGLPTTTEYLLRQGADPNIPSNRDNFTPLQRAVMDNRIPRIELLLRYGADINQRATATGNTALHSAVSAGRFEIVKYLLDNGADMNVVNREGLTPINMAILNNNMPIFRLLMDRGANIEIPDLYPSLIFAARENRFKFVKYLLSHGADKYVEDRFGDTAEDAARERHLIRVADYIRDYDEPLIKEPEL